MPSTCICCFYRNNVSGNLPQTDVSIYYISRACIETHNNVSYTSCMEIKSCHLILNDKAPLLANLNPLNNDGLSHGCRDIHKDTLPR